MVVYYNEAMCHAEKFIHHLQCQAYREGLYNPNMLILSISSKLLVRLQPNLVSWYSIISRSILWENGITASKIKVTAKVQNVSECLSGQYLLNHRTFCYQTQYDYATS